MKDTFSQIVELSLDFDRDFKILFLKFCVWEIDDGIQMKLKKNFPTVFVIVIVRIFKAKSSQHRPTIPLSAFKRIIFHLFISLCYYCAIIIIIIIIPGWALPDPEAYNIKHTHTHTAWEGWMDGWIGLKGLE